MPIVWIDATWGGLLACMLSGAGIACVVWLWWSRLTWPDMAQSRRPRSDLTGGIDRSPLEQRTLMWCSLHDGLLSMRLRRSASRFGRAAAHVAVAMVEAERAHRDLTGAPIGLPPPPRRMLSSLVAGRVIPCLVLAADVVLASLAVQGVAGDLGQDTATLVAAAVSTAYFVAGRMAVDGVLNRSVLRAGSSLLCVALLAFVMASLRKDHQLQWLVVCLVPFFVSVVATLLDHPEPPSVEAARAERQRRRRADEQAVARLGSRVARAASAGSQLSYRACRLLVARPLAASGDDHRITASVDVGATLAALGLSHELEVVSAGFALLARLRHCDPRPASTGDAAATPSLRSAA